MVDEVNPNRPCAYCGKPVGAGRPAWGRVRQRQYCSRNHVNLAYYRRRKSKIKALGLPWDYKGPLSPY